MPELPEVETIARGLRKGRDGPALPGSTIERATVHWPRHIDRLSPRAFQRRIRGRTIQAVRRRGKFLVCPLDRDTLLFHLRMSGDLTFRPSDKPPTLHAHTTFHLDSGWCLDFEDARKFGRVYLVSNPEEILGHLGPEPLGRAFTADVLQRRLLSKRRMLKPLLLDQSFLAGLGNIYTDEALHRAKIHPTRHSHTLTPPEVQALWEGIRGALREGIRHNGASIDWVYRGGNFQNKFHVYQRLHEPCTECGASIQRIVVGQRGTYICPKCQREVVR